VNANMRIAFQPLFDPLGEIHIPYYISYRVPKAFFKLFINRLHPFNYSCSVINKMSDFMQGEMDANENQLWTGLLSSIGFPLFHRPVVRSGS